MRSFDLQSLKKINDDKIARVDLLKQSTVSESEPSLFKKDQLERLDLFHDQINLSITKNEPFDQKTDDRILNPAFLCEKVKGFPYLNLQS